MASLEPRLNIWIESDGQVVLSGWRIALLEAIAETGSITSAAARMDAPYRVAWQKIRQMEQGLGVQLVQTKIGGPDGGGSSLTPAAREYIRCYHHVSDGLDEWVGRRFAEVLPSLPSNSSDLQK
jgi:molybdate transport system regulatory protein